MVISSPFFAARVMTLSGLLALASFSPLITVISEENPFAVFTNRAAGRACRPASGPTAVSFSTKTSSVPLGAQKRFGQRLVANQRVQIAAPQGRCDTRGFPGPGCHPYGFRDGL